MTFDFKKVMEEAKAEEHKEFVDAVAKEKDEGKAQVEVDKFMTEHFCSYNYVVATLDDLKGLLKQDVFDSGKSFAIGAGLVIGMCSSDEEHADKLLGVMKQMAHTVAGYKGSVDERLNLRVNIIRTAEAVKKEILIEGLQRAKDGKSPSFNPNDKEFRDRIMSRCKKTDLNWK